MLSILNSKGNVIISYYMPGDITIDIPNIKERYPDAVKLHIQLGLATELGVQNHITEITL